MIDIKIIVIVQKPTKGGKDSKGACVAAKAEKKS